MTNYKVKIAFHIHTNSSDGLYRPERILEEARKEQIDIIAITDHNEIAGSLEACEMQDQYGVTVIPGIEIFFVHAAVLSELLVYFPKVTDLEKFYREYLSFGKFLPNFKNLDDLIDIIKNNHGIFIAAHPKSKKGILTNRIEINLQAVESLNAMAQDIENLEAENYRKKNKLIGVAGSDLHIYLDSLKTYTLAESSNPIGINEVLDNLSGNKKNISFSIVDNFKKPKKERFYQKFICLFLDIKFLSRQLIFRKLFRK